MTIINKDISYFIDGQFIKATLLKDFIKDNGGRIRIGQKYGGKSAVRVLFFENVVFVVAYDCIQGRLLY